MESAIPSNSGPNPVTTTTTQQLPDTGIESQPAQSEADAQETEDKSAGVETETEITPQESETGVHTAETPATEAIIQAVENEIVVQSQSEPSENSGEIDSASKLSAPTEPAKYANSKHGAQKAKKEVKCVRDGRKYVPSKKAMIDPLKMDMSKPLVMPLTSSQLSLQCIECHIIFSDHKSKERHLKSSHPAEYEQCILRNALFACYVCDRHFTNSTELMAHQKAHIEKKPFKCPICSQAFNKSSELTLHKKIHFGRDGYACTDCGKPCKTLTLLKYHRRTHTGERPYVCKECGKRFTMSKALQKHIVLHFSEVAEGNEEDMAAKIQVKKNEGASSVKYSCSICKATFKSTKTRLHHMKTKHNALSAAASNDLSVGQQAKPTTPIITPISICQPALLQVEPNGPLQKVEANIDTEQIRRLIESLGNVQKVNQVVILGQVPPHAPPLEVQQITQAEEPVNLNLSPPQIDFIGLQQSELKPAEMDSSNIPCDSMEQTIILEPITPDGQLETPSFSELASHIVTGENIEVTLIQTEQIQRPEADVMQQIFQQSELSAIHSDPVNEIVCQNEDTSFKQDLEQTVILELTPALIPTVELEQSQSVPQNEITSSSLVLTTELEKSPDKTPDQTVIEDQELSLSVPPLLPTVELELTPLQTEQQTFPSCPLILPDTLTQALNESQITPQEEVGAQIQTVNLDESDIVKDDATLQDAQGKAQQEPSENLEVGSKEAQTQGKNLSESDNSFVKESVASQLETKQVPQISELPVNVMSAQELVKVRKRKPPRAFIFQGYMQDLVGSLYKDDLQVDSKPAKRQRTKKSRLVVKFGPQNKEKKNKKQKKPSQPHQPMDEKQLKITVPKKNITSQRKGRKEKNDKKAGQLVSTAKIKPLSLTHVPQEQRNKEDTRKNKIKRQKQEVRQNVAHLSEHKTAPLPVFKKKKQAKMLQKNQPKTPKVVKRKKNLPKEEEVNTKTGAISTDVSGQKITQESLLLLKGHKQPQLKVHKLDPSKASSQTQEILPQESHPMSQQSKDTEHPMTEADNNLKGEIRKKGGRPKKSQKALSLLSSLQVTRQPPEKLPNKPKTTRKRKAPLKVETEGVITSSHSKRALECKDCGERFSEVSSLQKHKAVVHIVESPGLTYTNGNVFEGVSKLDLYQLPKQHDKVVGLMNTATDWDTEPEMGEMALEDKERTVSFPALIPSPSLSVPPSDVDVSVSEHEGGIKTLATDQSDIFPEGPSPSDEFNKSEASQNLASDGAVNAPSQMKSLELREPMELEISNQEDDNSKHVSSKSEGQATTYEDIKEDLLLEVDLITVGEQNEREDSTSLGGFAQNESKGDCISDGGSTEPCLSPRTGEKTNEKSLTLHTVSCSTHQVEIKEEEEEEILIPRKKGGGGGVTRHAIRRRRRGTGGIKRGAISKHVSAIETVLETEHEKEQNECQIVQEIHANISCAEIEERIETGIKSSEPEMCPTLKDRPSTSTACLSSGPSTRRESQDESPAEEVECEEGSATTSVDEVVNERQLREEHDRESDQSPCIIIETLLTSEQRAADKEPCLTTTVADVRQGSDIIAENEVQVSQSKDIKVEENISDLSLVGPTCQSRQSFNVQPQHHHDIRTVLVKEETALVLNDAQALPNNRQIRWNVESVNNENTTTPSIESEGTRDCCVTPEFHTNQCIFYPVKEEEREVLLGAAQTREGNLSPEGSSDVLQTDLYVADNEESQDYLETRVRGLVSGPDVSDFADGQDFGAEANAEMLHQPDLRDFLHQNLDEEDLTSFGLPDPHLDSEAEVMACFYKNETNASQPDQMLHNSPTSSCQLDEHSDEKRTKEPIDYFCQYFDWDTWVEIVSCTNLLSNTTKTITAKEVAQFVGIHIAMGTLKFPSLRLYWEDLTKVPLIAEAMALSRFLELSHILKLAPPVKGPISSNARQERHDGDVENVQQIKTLLGRPSLISQHSDRKRQKDMPNYLGCSKTQTDPLWKVQPLLCRFRAGCQSLRRDGDYAVDQYLLPLMGKMHSNNNFSLYSTALIGFGGMLLHVDLKLTDKEDAIEKMVPKGSMLFLCKQELSTPAMLERLLVAGVHGAGRVGGARGQIGDEFVSSDGKLMLRRSHCGFILSTAGNGQRNMATLIDNFEKAQMSARLNKDLLNLYSIPLTTTAPACWPQTVLWYLTDLALVNSWLLYRQDHRAASAPLTLMAFRLEVSKALILSSSSDTQDSVPPQPPTETAHTANEIPNPRLIEECPLPDAAIRYDGAGHWPEQLGEGEGGRCRFGDCHRTSRVLCLKCCVFLCISRNHNCFLNFHNQGSLGKG